MFGIVMRVSRLLSERGEGQEKNKNKKQNNLNHYKLTEFSCCMLTTSIVPE